MTTQTIRVRLASDLCLLGSGAGVIEKSQAAKRIAEMLMPDEEPAVYDRMLNSENYVLRSMFDMVEHERDAARAEVERLKEELDVWKKGGNAWKEVANTREAKIAKAIAALSDDK